ncbi:uncharacterized protein LOC115406779 isoform X2 [Salarias fasciatus]|nr:uncharacterized protein LOC115406779 isoform X2 [Salarias fasciatus]XP_029972870.1 uncharacterized protein LOC115406779 isoform X2 [Salarias fasciatus]
MDLNTVVQDLPVLLDVPRSGSSEGGTIKEQCNIHMMKFWNKSIPKPPEDLEKKLQEHLNEVKKVVAHHLRRLKPWMQPHGLMGYLEDCCHRRMIQHLQSLIRRVSSSRSCFKLLHWARHSYLRIEEFSNHDYQKINGWDEWESTAKDILIQTEQEEQQVRLKKILEAHKRQKTCDNEESYILLDVDVIKFTFDTFEKVKAIDHDLSDRVLRVCSRELLVFVKGYNECQRVFLKKKPATVHFLKTLRTCRGIRKNIQDRHMEEIVELLTEMETFTKELLTKVVTDDVEKNIKRYFRSDNKRIFPFDPLEKHFPQLDFAAEERRAVMGDIYKGIAHVYFKHLIGTSMRKLRKKWWTDTNIGKTVQADAVELHIIISRWAEDVPQYNNLLLKIREVLACSDMEAMKQTMAFIEKECDEQSEDLQLLPDLLLWADYSPLDVKRVLEVLQSPPSILQMPSWFVQYYLCCCC